MKKIILVAIFLFSALQAEGIVYNDALADTETRNGIHYDSRDYKQVAFSGK